MSAKSDLSIGHQLDRRRFMRFSAWAIASTSFGHGALAGTAEAKGGPPAIIKASPAVMRLPRSTLSLLTGHKLKLRQVMECLHAAGFKEEEPLLAGTAIAIAESGLFSSARNWHPEKGYRSATDVIAVKGPPEIWLNGCQLHSDRGVWQIASYWHSYYPDTAADDPARCAEIAFQISSSGTDFKPWTSYASGSAQKHFNKPFQGWPALRPLVRRFLDYQNSNPNGTAQTNAIPEDQT